MGPSDAFVERAFQSLWAYLVARCLTWTER